MQNPNSQSEGAVFALPGVQETIDRLPAKAQRNVLRAYLLVGMTVKDIAVKTGARVDTVEAVLARAERNFYLRFAPR